MSENTGIVFETNETGYRREGSELWLDQDGVPFKGVRAEFSKIKKPMTKRFSGS